MVSTSNGFPWELVIWAGVIGFCAIPLFLWRSFRSVRSWVYEGREKKLAVVLGEQIKEKCKLLEKLSFVQKSYEGYERESSLKDVSVGKAAAEVQRGNTVSKKQLKEEKYERSRQHQLMADISEMRQSLEDRLKSLKSKIAEIKMPLKMFQMNGEQLKRDEKLSKQDKTINYTTDQLEKYRKQAKHLEEELERRILSSQEQILLHQKEEHDNWLAARTAEIKLNGLKKENAKYRHKLTDTEIKFKCLHKDPCAVDVPNTGFGREHYTNVTDMRRGTPFPPSPPGTLFGVSPHHIPPSDFPGPPHAPFAVRNAYPLRGFPAYLPPRPGFFPPTPKY
ncbi:LOW QUALITY PROTEIN: Melanoma inhibitory activity protein 2 [Plecturocebus cupreus]